MGGNYRAQIYLCESSSQFLPLVEKTLDSSASYNKAMLSHSSSLCLLASCFHCSSRSLWMTTKPVFQSNFKRSYKSSDTLERRLHQHTHVHAGESLERQKERLFLLPPRKQHITRSAGTPSLPHPTSRLGASQAKRNAAMATPTRLLLEPVLYTVSCLPMAKLSNNRFHPL